MPAISNDCLSSEQRIVFMDVITESLRVSQRTHLFNWLQGEFQYLLGHEVMIFGVKSSDSDSYQYEYFTSARYFSDAQFTKVIENGSGLVSHIINLWKNIASPLFVSNLVKPIDCNNYAVINFDDNELKSSELKCFVAHGFGDNHSKISSVVVFGRLHKVPSANHAHILELIMPHLHCALIRVTSSKSNVVVNNENETKVMTKRESEVLQWLHMGKTNWEISSILDVSPLTVKNHVQNVLRKLDVQNRSQAAVKAAKLGLIKMLK
ncbi:XrtB/PEP-CTERM-associated transcriptional regulator EpsA [Methylotenera sp.]|uniref:XrtB/PEP-CTERM-associated transcriptional regulator EpsA n=1 Tax=Methylotenera sp. TaxID=2051956 RepID=UPI00272EF4E0|nr:XrtB/PEP-CTERM-associated transcriptional regulator EpsA [Methylotenera sp.]MDP2229648.1 transcriptional regulator EpsA [Methylotenera sp.]